MSRNIRTSHVYVANLSRDATLEEIRTLFALAEPQPVHIASDRGQGAVLSAVLEFSRPELAAEAVRACDGLEFAGRRLRVTTTRRAQQRPAAL
jgi:hypothetical protein